MHDLVFPKDPPFREKNPKYFKKKAKNAEIFRKTRRDSPESSLKLDQPQILIELDELYRILALLINFECNITEKNAN